MEKELYELPEDLVTMWKKYNAMEDIIKLMLYIPFMLNRALKLQIKNNDLRSDIWDKTYLVFPRSKDEDPTVYFSNKDQYYIRIDKK